MIMSNNACRRRQKKLLGNIPQLTDMVENYPIIFHDTTPRLFECVEGCDGCCTTCYFFEDEFKVLPKKYHKHVHSNDELFLNDHQVTSTEKGRCIFSKVNGCQIHPYKPSRCKIYPYFFVIDETKECILVMCQSFSDWPDIMVEHKEGMCGTLCPGLLSGGSVEEKIKSYARPFLRNILREKQHSLFLHFFEDTDILLNEEMIKIFLMNIKHRGFIPYPHKSGKWIE